MISIFTSRYSHPVQRLFALRDPDVFPELLDYNIFGIDTEHIPELVDVVKNSTGERAFDFLVNSDGLAHCANALAFLRAMAGIDPVFRLTAYLENQPGGNPLDAPVTRYMCLAEYEELAMDPLLRIFRDESESDTCRRTALYYLAYAVSRVKGGQILDEAVAVCVMEVLGRATTSWELRKMVTELKEDLKMAGVRSLFDLL